MPTGSDQKTLFIRTFSLLLVYASISQVSSAGPQDNAATANASAEATQVQPVTIADEPKTIDPASLMAARLAMPTTVKFQQASMKEVYRWLQEDQKLSISVDAAAMRDKGILSSELITDQLNNEPLYLLLDRLKSLGIGWYEESDDLFFTTTDAANMKMINASYNLGELLDAGFDGELIVESITSCAGGASIDQGDEDGAVVLLGDVAFARQTQHVQREIRGLLAGLKNPARRTLTLDPPRHADLRAKLLNKLSVSLEEVPLSEAIEELGKISGADIRLHVAELKRAGVRDRSPVTIEMADQKLGLILQTALSELKLTYLIQDGVIWVVRKETARTICHTAIYDVRDLCRDFDESNSLKYALMEQAGGEWEENGSEFGNLLFPAAGVMVVRHTEPMLDGILQLLENYRSALRESKPRKKAGPDPKEILTYYYRVPTEMAKELEVTVPLLIRSETWKTESNSEAIGTIIRIKSTSDLKDSSGRIAVPAEAGKTGGYVIVVENSVLIIRHMREVHTEIDDFINKITNGERPIDPNYGGGLGGGGFGGGYFNLRNAGGSDVVDGP